MTNQRAAEGSVYDCEDESNVSLDEGYMWRGSMHELHL